MVAPPSGGQHAAGIVRRGSSRARGAAGLRTTGLGPLPVEDGRRGQEESSPRHPDTAPPALFLAAPTGSTPARAEGPSPGAVAGAELERTCGQWNPAHPRPPARVRPFSAWAGERGAEVALLQAATHPGSVRLRARAPMRSRGRRASAHPHPRTLPWRPSWRPGVHPQPDSAPRAANLEAW